MHKLYFLLLAFWTMFTSFETQEHPAKVQNENLFKLEAHTWYLTTIYRENGYTQVLSRKAFIHFNTTGGSVNGNGGCNNFGGSLSINDGSVKLQRLFSTKMYCEDMHSIESDFLKYLSKITRYEINGKKLLLYNQDTLMLELEMDQEN